MTDLGMTNDVFHSMSKSLNAVDSFCNQYSIVFFLVCKLN